MRTPDPIIQQYKLNAYQYQTFDLVSKSEKIGLPYFVLSNPKDEKFKKQGAVLMIESWTNNSRSFFTGLRRIADNVLYGDHRDPNNKKSLFCMISEKDTYQIHYFKGFYLKSYKKQILFFFNYFRHLQPEYVKIENAEVSDAIVTDAIVEDAEVSDYFPTNMKIGD